MRRLILTATIMASVAISLVIYVATINEPVTPEKPCIHVPCNHPAQNLSDKDSTINLAKDSIVQQPSNHIN